MVKVHRNARTGTHAVVAHSILCSPINVIMAEKHRSEVQRPQPQMYICSRYKGRASVSSVRLTCTNSDVMWAGSLTNDNACFSAVDEK